ncbi:50S ribosomal protein L35 [Candidatus Peregrinibacteria bacterium]|jgi:large subunit ribosomal protein L35|nr:50S ribosomal protein L35 [Candidatus Peregrinibacteria bacterium]MBT4631813.1 50S ribosomal protein L35 [Candidatus Peregrinibacteria bacterium]
MPAKAKTGKQRTHGGAKKRVRLTGTGKVRMQKAGCRHRLHPKNDRQLNLGGRLLVVEGKAAKTLKTMLSN